MQSSVRPGIDGVEPEVPPLGILCPVFRKGDDGAAAIGLHIPSQAGDLEGFTINDGGDCAVIVP